MLQLQVYLYLTKMQMLIYARRQQEVLISSLYTVGSHV